MVIRWLRRWAERRDEKRARFIATVVDCIPERDEIVGRDLRARLAERGYRMGLGSFYVKMRRIEEEDHIRSETVFHILDDGTQITQRWFSRVSQP